MYINIEHIARQPNWLHHINAQNFEQYALSIFQYQVKHCSVYQDFVAALGRIPDRVQSVVDIPFLPISFFKTHKVVSGQFEPELIFESSGTTQTQNSKHLVKNANLYKDSFLLTFKQFYGVPQDYVFLCLLPSYLERGNSSLVYMANELIRQSGKPESGFYLDEWEELAGKLQQLKEQHQKVILLGVTFALLDFAERYPMDLSGTIVMETGGMKGRKEEWTRGQVHDFLQEKWNIGQVHSEYGMTELLSQAYATGNGVFHPAPTIQVFVREENDPFDLRRSGSGCLNIIDLANIYSCAFIATDDIARFIPDSGFEVLGRLDNSALRGCSLMVV